MSTRKISRFALVEERSLLGSGTFVEPGARLFGKVETGPDVHIGSNAVLYGPLKIGKNSYVGPNCVLGFPTVSEISELVKSHEVKREEPIVIGENCTMRSCVAVYPGVRVGDGVSFGHNVLVREKVTVGDESKLGTNAVVDGSCTIGGKVWIQTGVYMCTYSRVEDSVFLGPCCVFTNDKYVTQKPFKLIGPTVKRGASVGANALLFPGITVGERAVVGAQAMVNVDIPPRTIYAGIPARKIGEVSQDWHSSLLKN